MATVRLFVAAELPVDVRRALGEIEGILQRRGGAQAGRWVQPDGIHLTLHFLGDVAVGRVEEINQAVGRACVGICGFTATVSGLGCFPNLRRPRVIWVGIREETGQLHALQRAIGSQLRRIGLPPEERPFHPHLTLARVRQGATREALASLAQAISMSEVGDVAQLPVVAVSVMKSDLQPSGAIYTELGRHNLEASAAPESLEAERGSG